MTGADHERFPWIAAQRWEQVLFVNWRVPADAIRPLVPEQLELDSHGGDTWVSLLPLRMAHVHLRDVPPVPGLTGFPELNLRTYVVHDGRPGVYFFSLDAPGHMMVWLGRHVFHLAYDLADMSMDEVDGKVVFASHRRGANAEFRATYCGIGDAAPAADGSLEQFLTERYCMYALDHAGHLRRGDIRHDPWQLRRADADIALGTVAQAAGLPVPPDPEVVLYSDATDNVVWPMVSA